MEVVAQTLDEILENLSPLEVEWKDEIAVNIIERLQSFRTPWTWRRARCWR